MIPGPLEIPEATVERLKALKASAEAAVRAYADAVNDALPVGAQVVINATWATMLTEVAAPADGTLGVVCKVGRDGQTMPINVRELVPGLV